jgi:hypothetical protein
VPVPYGVVQYKGREEVINVRNYMVNDEVTEAYGKSLQLSNVKKLDFSGNMLSAKGSFNLLRGVNQRVEEINLSNNRVAHDSIL